MATKKTVSRIKRGGVGTKKFVALKKSGVDISSKPIKSVGNKMDFKDIETIEFIRAFMENEGYVCTACGNPDAKPFRELIVPKERKFMQKVMVTLKTMGYEKYVDLTVENDEVTIKISPKSIAAAYKKRSEQDDHLLDVSLRFENKEEYDKHMKDVHGFTQFVDEKNIRSWMDTFCDLMSGSQDEIVFAPYKDPIKESKKRKEAYLKSVGLKEK